MIRYLAKVKRQSYDDGKSVVNYTGKEYVGWFTSMGLENEALAFDKLGKDFIFIFKWNWDIQEGDILEIDGVNYRIKAKEQIWTSTRNNYLKLLLIKDD